MVCIRRKDDFGNVRIEKFERLKDAFKYLKSSEVKDNIVKGFEYSFVEEDTGQDPSGG